MLKFDGVIYAFDSKPVLHDVTFAAQRGEVTCLIGPSGCGKTTLLRLAAGLLSSQAGQISLDGKILSQPGEDMPPEHRPVGLVFQEGALFPHLSVGDNVAFGLDGAADKKAERVQELLSSVGLADLGRRFPHTLSGGQQQRVALARALAPQPAVLLFDEPYANLDMHRRTQLREQARALIKRSQVIGLFVTHDPEEVLELADHIVVLDQGRVLQTGTPEAVYDNPATSLVAGLFGQGQRIEGELAGDVVSTPFGIWERACVAPQSLQSGEQQGRVVLLVRPDVLTVNSAQDGLPVVDIRLSGADDLLHVRAGDGHIIKASLRRPHSFAVGDSVELLPDPGSIFAFAN